MVRIEVTRNGKLIKAVEAETEAEALALLGSPALKLPERPSIPDPQIPPMGPWVIPNRPGPTQPRWDRVWCSEEERTADKEKDYGLYGYGNNQPYS